MDLTTKMECDVVLLLVLLMLLVLSAFLYAGARSSVSGRLSEDLARETCHTEVSTDFDKGSVATTDFTQLKACLTNKSAEPERMGWTTKRDRDFEDFWTSS